MLRVARCSARKDRVRAINQLRSLVSTAPEDLRAELRGLSISRAGAQGGGPAAQRAHRRLNANKLAMRSLARRVRDIDAEVAELDAVLRPLVSRPRPTRFPLRRRARHRRSSLVAAGDNPERLRNEATFAHLCGVSPLDASSGKQLRHRLNRGGDRQANSPCGASSSPGWRRTRERSATSSDGARRALPRLRRCAV